MKRNFAVVAATRLPEELWAPGWPPPECLDLTCPAGSGFFAGAGLAERWRSAGVRRVAIGGGGTEFGVAETARAALASGYETWLLADACVAGRAEAGGRAALDLRAAGVFVATHDRFLVLNASCRVPTALALVEPVRRWAARDAGAAAAWAALAAAA